MMYLFFTNGKETISLRSTAVDAVVPVRAATKKHNIQNGIKI